jgi:hypothetical protein
MDENSENSPVGRLPKFCKDDSETVKAEIKCQMEICTRAWLGLGMGRVLILKDDIKGISTYFVYEEGVFTFYDRRGGSQKVLIEEITEIAGY